MKGYSTAEEKILKENKQTVEIKIVEGTMLANKQQTV
jgi:hypothetical protein